MGWIANNFDLKYNKKSTYAEELYEIIIEYSKIKSVNDLEIIAVNDANGECGLSNLLEYCAILYRPENSDYYVVPTENATSIPKYLPQNYQELVDNCTGLCYGIMLGCLSRQEKFLAYPQFDEMEKHIDQLCLEECMQFFLFYNRLSLRYGQQYFFEKWKDGTTLRVVKRMQMLRNNS